MSVLILLAVFFNAQGVFIEHHSIAGCESSVFVDSGHASCGSACDAHGHTEDLNHHVEHCNLFDFDNEEHKSSCACFAEYIQIPVFYSEFKKDIKDILKLNFPHQVIYFLLEANTPQDDERIDFSPPDILYQNTSRQLLFCTFLC